MTLELLYNTTREEITLPEYGRTIQSMLQHAKSITDARKRQKTVEAIIQMMQIVNPVQKNQQEDYREKLWNHAFRIANYELEVVPPPGIVITKIDEKPRPEPLGYPQTTKKFRHYGHNVQTLMQKAIEMPDGPKKEGFVEVIASYMKLAYKTWNKEHYVSDDVVKDDLELLSEGQLELHEGHSSLDILAYSANRKEIDIKRSRGGRKRSGSSSNNGRKERGGGSGNNSGNNRSGNNNNRRRRK